MALGETLVETMIRSVGWVGFAMVALLLAGVSRAQVADGKHYGYGGYDDGRDQVRCESRDGRTEWCRIDTRYGVVLQQQHSRSACIEGSTWGWDRNGVWVAQGCRATFAAGRGGWSGSPGYPPGGGWGQGGFAPRVTCESHDGDSRFCNMDTRNGVVLVRQLSRASCVQGRSWGWDRRGVWVSDGCRAEFTSGQGQGYGSGYGAQTIRCESHNDRVAYCDARGGRSIELVRQLSRAACVEGRSWGWDRRGIWVSDGCRADFRVW